MKPSFSEFALAVKPEGAFEVLAVAKALIADGKDVIELEIGDSPFDTPRSAVDAAISAIDDGQTHYAPSAGVMEFRVAASEYVNREFGLHTDAENIVAGPGAKTFQTLFCEAVLNPGDGVLVFSPYFPTYAPNIERRGARLVTSALRRSREFRPNIDDIVAFLEDDPAPKAIFLNSPQNPTGGIATKQDLEAIANLVRDRDVAVFSDEPYDQMAWSGAHHSILAEPDMMAHCVGAYTFSKSFSMSGWRLGFAVSDRAMADMLAKLTNTAISCVPPFIQMAGAAALAEALEERNAMMAHFRDKLTLMVDRLNAIANVQCLRPGGSFYTFPCVADVCNRFNITSHGLAMYLLEAADPHVGVACLGGECFGDAGGGFLRLSSSEPVERIAAGIDFIADVIEKPALIEQYLERHPDYRLAARYSV